jgi:hypothetical protein
VSSGFPSRLRLGLGLSSSCFISTASRDLFFSEVLTPAFLGACLPSLSVFIWSSAALVGVGLVAVCRLGDAFIPSFLILVSPSFFFSFSSPFLVSLLLSFPSSFFSFSENFSFVFLEITSWMEVPKLFQLP